MNPGIRYCITSLAKHLTECLLIFRLDQAETATATASVVEPYDRNKSSSVDSLGTFETVEVFESDQAALIHPAEVAVSNTVFERAEPVLTPIGNYIHLSQNNYVG